MGPSNMDNPVLGIIFHFPDAARWWHPWSPDASSKSSKIKGQRLRIDNCVIIKHGFGGFPDLWQDNFVLILCHSSILTSCNKLARKEKKRTQQQKMYAFKIIKEKLCKLLLRLLWHELSLNLCCSYFMPHHCSCCSLPALPLIIKSLHLLRICLKNLFLITTRYEKLN